MQQISSMSMMIRQTMFLRCMHGCVCCHLSLPDKKAFKVRKTDKISIDEASCASTYLHVLGDQPDAILADGDAVELHHIAVAGCKFEDADLRQECLLRLLVTLVQHFDGHLLNRMRHVETTKAQ